MAGAIAQGLGNFSGLVLFLKYYNQLCKIYNLCLYNNVNVTAIPTQLQ